MSGAYVEIPGSYRPAPEQVSSPQVNAHAVGEVKPTDKIEVSVYLKSRDDDSLLQLKPLSTEQATSEAHDKLGSRESLRAERAQTHADDFEKVVAFANTTGLTVVKTDPARRLVKLAGPADKLEAAFRTKLHYYNNGAVAFRARSGTLSAPKAVADVIESVLGLDTRPQAQPRLTHHPAPHAVGGHLPNEVAKLYNFPSTPGKGKGQCIAIIELGGGYRHSDNKNAFAAMGLKVPRVVPVSVSGGLNQPGGNSGADGEVALDIQVAGGAAPGATLAVYFAPNTTQGFVDAISRAVHDEVHRPSVISISWGSPETRWTDQGVQSMTSALRDAARLGVTVFVASGDNLATDGEADNRAHVDFPASSPYAVGCGGTVVDANAGQITAEQVWNRAGGGTGGGISDKFPAPAYQANANIPKSINDGKIRRGVPDVAGDADPESGYRIIVAGASALIGGTSAVAPLWAGLFALVNEACGKPAGFVQPLLYGNPGAFRDITQGDNKSGGLGYAAGAGWDACTGLGSPNGEEIRKLFTSKGAAAVTQHEPKRSPKKHPVPA